MEGLGKALDALSELQKIIKEDRLQKIFKELSKTVFETSRHFIESGELTKLYCSSHLKYHLQETESYQDILAFREQTKTNFFKKERHLYERKERLFT